MHAGARTWKTSKIILFDNHVHQHAQNQGTMQSCRLKLWIMWKPYHFILISFHLGQVSVATTTINTLVTWVYDWIHCQVNSGLTKHKYSLTQQASAVLFFMKDQLFCIINWTVDLELCPNFWTQADRKERISLYSNNQVLLHEVQLMK
jgi:hypothetical protein